MGVGKSTIGRLIAQATQRQFKDTDQEIEERCGADIPWIFDIEGEEGFRNREASVLRDLIEEPGLVLATGGGIVTRPENRELLKQNGNVVYLTASIEQLVKRTRKDRKRPLLQVHDPRAKIVELIKARGHWYEECAQAKVITDHKSPKTVAETILSLLKQSARA